MINILLFVQCFYLEKRDLFGLNYYKCYLPVTAPNIHTPTCLLAYHFLVRPALGLQYHCTLLIANSIPFYR